MDFMRWSEMGISDSGVVVCILLMGMELWSASPIFMATQGVVPLHVIAENRASAVVSLGSGDGFAEGVGELGPCVAEG
jgi:hypothetical protein